METQISVAFLVGGHRPGPKGPSKELIAIVEFKRYNPRVGCSRIALQIARAFPQMF
jgi:hypothetical protein